MARIQSTSASNEAGFAQAGPCGRPTPSAARSATQAHRAACQKGFTIIELLVVAAMIGIFAGIITVQVKNTMLRARMNTLKHDLRVMRDLIQQHKVDKKVYPESLQALVDQGYMRQLPVDPITGSADSWIELHEEDESLELAFDFATPTGFEGDGQDPEAQDAGVRDVQSGAAGADLDGVPYSEY